MGPGMERLSDIRLHKNRSTPITAPISGNAHIENLALFSSHLLPGTGMTEYVEKAVRIDLSIITNSFVYFSRLAVLHTIS